MDSPKAHVTAVFASPAGRIWLGNRTSIDVVQKDRISSLLNGKMAGKQGPPRYWKIAKGVYGWEQMTNCTFWKATSSRHPKLRRETIGRSLRIG